jgi:hypothetical protein
MEGSESAAERSSAGWQWLGAGRENADSRIWRERSDFQYRMTCPEARRNPLIQCGYSPLGVLEPGLRAVKNVETTLRTIEKLIGFETASPVDLGNTEDIVWEERERYDLQNS